MAENEARRSVEIGSRWVVRAPWPDLGLGRPTRIGEIVTVHGEDRDGDPTFTPDHPEGVDASIFASDLLLRAEPAPAVEPDRKPRGVKPPMALIPWDVVPAAWIPEAVQIALEIPDEAEEGPESFAARVIRILLETTGDDLLYEIARVMGHGAAKYGPGNWQSSAWAPSDRLEYESAMLRHLYADAIGEATDPDSGLAHKAHAAASAMILEWHDRRVAGATVAGAA